MWVGGTKHSLGPPPRRLGIWLIFAVGYAFLFGRGFENLDSSIKIAQTERARRVLSYERELKRRTIYISAQSKSDVTKGLVFPSLSP
jgi:hypothetical protein